MMHIDTPLLESTPLSQRIGVPVFLKMDALQPSGSFKIRGIGHVCEKAFAQGERHFVAASGGNAGLAVAFACRKLGARATIVVPKRASASVKKCIEAEGAKVIVAGEIWDDAHAHAQELIRQHGGRYIHPFDEPDVWHGHATLVHELAKAAPKPGAILVAVGGGGLLCGILEGLHAVGWQDVPVIAVETAGAACLHQSVLAGRQIELEQVDSIATSLSSRVIAAESFAWTKRHRIITTTVSDRAAVDACKGFLEDHRVLVEPACGAALAPIYQRAPVLEEFSSLTVIVCGGSGVSLELLHHWDRNLPRSNPIG